MTSEPSSFRIHFVSGRGNAVEINHRGGQPPEVNCAKHTSFHPDSINPDQREPMSTSAAAHCAQRRIPGAAEFQKSSPAVERFDG